METGNQCGDRIYFLFILARKGKVSAVRKHKNEIDVILTPSDGHAWKKKLEPRTL